ncbi:hypothetical protein V8F20_001228 [Naviculisporaceae sp. PSN 640]
MYHNVSFQLMLACCGVVAMIYDLILWVGILEFVAELSSMFLDSLGLEKESCGSCWVALSLDLVCVGRVSPANGTAGEESVSRRF